MIGIILSLLLIFANIFIFIFSVKIEKKEFPDQICPGELGYKVIIHPAATALQFFSMLLAVLIIRLIIDKGYYWSILFGIIIVLVNLILSLIVLYFFKSFSEDKYEKLQGYFCILHLAIIAIISMIAAIIR